MIKQSVLNSFNRCNIPYTTLDNTRKDITVYNRFTGIPSVTTELVAYLITWVYNTSNEYERGLQRIAIADFDRIRYFVLAQDQEAYMNCLD